jgi:hypothetical protein
MTESAAARAAPAATSASRWGASVLARARAAVRTAAPTPAALGTTAPPPETARGRSTPAGPPVCSTVGSVAPPVEGADDDGWQDVAMYESAAATVEILERHESDLSGRSADACELSGRSKGDAPVRPPAPREAHADPALAGNAYLQFMEGAR